MKVVKISDVNKYRTRRILGMVFTIVALILTLISLNLRPHTHNYLWISVVCVALVMADLILLLKTLRDKRG